MGKQFRIIGKYFHYMYMPGLLLMILFLIALGEPAWADTAKIVIPKKIISIVFDDSGSMIDSNYSYSKANYAIQAFAGLLNESDELYITYMSDLCDGIKHTRTYDMHHPGEAVREIREDASSMRNTPLEAVDVAGDQLMALSDNDPTTQYWLVVMTDGYPAQNVDESQSRFSDYQEALDYYASCTMNNGTKMNIYFLGIGENLQTDVVKGNGDNLNVIYGGNDIIPTMADMANLITGRIPFDNVQVSGDTAVVHCDVPTYAISVLSQGMQAQVSTVKTEEAPLDVRNISLKYTENPNLFGGYDTTLVGNTAYVSNGSGIIPAGDIIFTFSEELSNANLTIMYQPAIGLEITVDKSGMELDDLSLLIPDEEVDVQIRIIDPETGAEIPADALPSGTIWHIRYVVEGQEIGSADGMELPGVQVGEGENTIAVDMTIPGYVPSGTSRTFHVDGYLPEIDLKLEVYYRGDLYYDSDTPSSSKLDLLEEGDLVDVILVAKDSATGGDLDLTRIKGGLAYTNEYEVDGVLQESSNQVQLRDLQLKSGQNVIRGIVTPQDKRMSPAQTEVAFTLLPPKVMALLDDDNLAIFPRSKMKKGELPADAPVVYITGDGIPLTKNECKQKSILVDESSIIVESPKGGMFYNRFGIRLPEIEVYQKDDGGFWIYPVRSVKIFPFLIRPGTYTLTVRLNTDASKTAELSFVITSSLQDWLPLLYILILLLIIWYILHQLFFRKKFGDFTVDITVYKDDGYGDGIRDRNYERRVVLKRRGRYPLGIHRASQKIDGLNFIVIADELGNPCIPAKELKKFGIWGTSTSRDPEGEFSHIREDIEEKTRKRDKNKLDSEMLTNVPLYVWRGNRLFSIKA